MQSLKSERAKKEYEQFVKEVTPKQNLFCNMAKAFIVGGLICVVGRFCSISAKRSSRSAKMTPAPGAR